METLEQIRRHLEYIRAAPPKLMSEQDYKKAVEYGLKLIGEVVRLRQEAEVSEGLEATIEIMNAKMEHLIADWRRVVAEAQGMEQELDRLRKENERLQAALSNIAERATVWDANHLGNVQLQRTRWKRLAQLARAALEGEHGH